MEGSAKLSNIDFGLDLDLDFLLFLPEATKYTPRAADSESGPSGTGTPCLEAFKHKPCLNTRYTLGYSKIYTRPGI